MDTPMITSLSGFNPTENMSYKLKCNINESNPKPITRYEWLQDGNIVNGSADILSFPSIKRTNTGNWTCKGIIDQNGVKVKKESTSKPVVVFCK